VADVDIERLVAAVARPRAAKPWIRRGPRGLWTLRRA